MEHLKFPCSIQCTVEMIFSLVIIFREQYNSQKLQCKHVNIWNFVLHSFKSPKSSENLFSKFFYRKKYRPYIQYNIDNYFRYQMNAEMIEK